MAKRKEDWKEQALDSGVFEIGCCCLELAGYGCLGFFFIGTLVGMVLSIAL